MLRSLVGSSDVLANAVHRRRDHRIRVVDILQDFHPASIDGLVDGWRVVGQCFGREFLVDALWQEQRRVVLRDASFEQVDGVVPLEDDEAVRVDDVSVDGRERLIRHRRSLRRLVDGGVQVVDRGRLLGVRFDRQYDLAELL